MLRTLAVAIVAVGFWEQGVSVADRQTLRAGARWVCATCLERIKALSDHDKK